MLAFETRALCKYYRRGSRSEVRALHDFTLAVPQGSFTVVCGPSGCGKTTLLALLGALERPTSGQVLFQEQDLANCSDFALARLRQRMGFIFQDHALLPKLSVWENITYPLIPRGISRAERYDRAIRLLDRFGMAGKESARPGDLSGGEQQRVAVARALAGQPEVVLADEPTSNLDDSTGAAVIALLQQAHAEGKTLVVSTHDSRLMALATRVYTLEAGRLQDVRDVCR